ncbi:MAG: DNA replication and repair protein RecF [Cyanobacteria bacterium REEB67]|nr:DNA replication and repair protein RecF [Cyanobacteria bacterium REEB67]
MQVNQVTVKNFRNYQSATLELSPGRNILIGENAQGKTNLLEAIEIISTGRSDRAASDRELIAVGANECLIELVYAAKIMQGMDETVSLTISQKERLSRRVRINGLNQPASARVSGRFLSRLTTVSFKAQDLNLLRGGPKFRRDWLDELALKIRPAHHELHSKYEKIVAQRNRLLKNFFEKGQLSVSDQDELKVWDKQLSYYGALVIKSRVDALIAAIPESENFHAGISGRREKLGCNYVFRQNQKDVEGHDSAGSSASTLEATAGGAVVSGDVAAHVLDVNEIHAMEVKDLALTIMRNLRERRAEEIARRQTLTGPHRDDVSFDLNGMAATAYASQGQQRSLVLALKLAELKLVGDVLEEPPLLLLDDVLAELDLMRQGMLMQLVSEDMQTLITTTHLSGFKAEWIEGANIVEVVGGSLRPRLEAAY